MSRASLPRDQTRHHCGRLPADGLHERIRRIEWLAFGILGGVMAVELFQPSPADLFATHFSGDWIVGKRPKRGKPMTPTQIAKLKQELREREAQRAAEERANDKDPSTWAANILALSLPTNDNGRKANPEDIYPVGTGVETVKDRVGKVTRRFRSDVFDLLYSRGVLPTASHNAARRLQEDLALRAGLGTPDLVDFVDFSGSADLSGQGFRQSQLAAGYRIDEVLAEVGSCDAQLLKGLVEPGVIKGQIIAWRTVVLRQTGESQEAAQGALVRSACRKLANAYEAYDQQSPDYRRRRRMVRAFVGLEREGQAV